MKMCPFCAEEIQEAAKKCKHCGEWLSDEPAKTSAEPIKGIPCSYGSCNGKILDAGYCTKCFRMPEEVSTDIKKGTNQNKEEGKQKGVLAYIVNLVSRFVKLVGVLLLGIIIVISICIVYFTMKDSPSLFTSLPPSPPSGNTATAQGCEDTALAFVMSKEFVKKRLRSPSTADFPHLYSDGVRVEYQGDCTHNVWAYVDASNAFGAIIREKYYAKVNYDKGDDSWILQDLQMHE